MLELGGFLKNRIFHNVEIGSNEKIVICLVQGLEKCFFLPESGFGDELGQDFLDLLRVFKRKVVFVGRLTHHTFDCVVVKEQVKTIGGLCEQILGLGQLILLEIDHSNTSLC